MTRQSTGHKEGPSQGRRQPSLQELADGLPHRILEADAADGATAGEPSPALRGIEEDLSKLERLIAEFQGPPT